MNAIIADLVVFVVPPHASNGHRCGVYPSSSLTDAEWVVLEPLLPPPGNTEGRGGRPEKHCRRMILDAILYLVRGGIAWRQLPAEFPPPTTVHGIFVRWIRCGGVAARPRHAAGPTTGAHRTRPLPDRGNHRLPDGARGRHGAPVDARVGRRQENERPQTPHRRRRQRVAARGGRHRRIDPPAATPRSGYWRVCVTRSPRSGWSGPTEATPVG